jgi:HTH-type transcriptional regulator/antitoxin HigA
MIAEAGYVVELLITHKPARPRNRRELARLAALLETLAANEKKQTPAIERFIETLTALIMQYEDEIEPDPERSPAGVLKYLMEERGLRQTDLVPVPGSKSYVSQILSGHWPIGKEAAYKLAEFFRVSAYSFIWCLKRPRSITSRWTW